MRNEGRQDGGDALLRWEPARYVRKLDPFHAKLSRGFLRCKPQKWFPGLAAQWLPLFHSLNVEAKVLSVTPDVVVPVGLDFLYEGAIDEEPVLVGLSALSARTMVELTAPDLQPAAEQVVLEYLVRRLLSSLALAWTGPESTAVRFHHRVEPQEVRGAGAVEISMTLNNRPVGISLILGKGLLGRLDWLWRRQVQTSMKAGSSPALIPVQVELAQLAVPPSMLGDYTRPGTVVDLEIPLTDVVSLRQGGKPWLPARLCQVDQLLGFEVIPGPVPNPIIPDGTTRLTIQFGSIELDAATIAELSQVGSIFPTELPISDQVELFIHGEIVARAKLCSYEGRFAISVDS